MRVLLHTLGLAHSQCFQCLRDVDNIQKGIEFNSLALAMTPDDHPDFPHYLSILAVSLGDRFEHLGELNDIDKAIEYSTRAVASTHQDDPALSDRLFKLGLSFSCRFGRLGELNDLDKAVEYQSQWLAIAPTGCPYLPDALGELGNAHRNRFQLLGKLDDLEKAIEYQCQELALIPNSHPQLLNRLANLATSHNLRFQRLGGLDDLDKSVEYKSRALALTPDGHPDLQIHLTNLALAYKERFRHLENPNDLQKSIEYEARALTATNDNHPDSSRWHFSQAFSYLRYYKHSNDPIHLQKALHFFRKASMSSTEAPRVSFKHAREWAAIASIFNTLDPIEAYQTTIDLLPEFIWLGATTAQRYEDLQMAEALAVDAAYAAITSSNFPLALEWLEHARCIVWSQSIMLRSPMDKLKACHPSLAARLKAVANELHNTSLNSGDMQAASSNSMTPEEVRQRHHQLAKEYNELLNQTRTLSGFEDFLQPVRTNRLTHAARNGPVVVINCHQDGCDVLLIRPQQADVTHIPLPNFNRNKARAARSELKMSMESLRLRERGAYRRPMAVAGEKCEFESVLAVLWYDVVKPVLDHLGYTHHAQRDNLPHITWCPTGALTFLPLHAAGDYDQPHSRVFDFAISSYIPTLTAILESAPCLLSRDYRVLSVGQAATPGHAPLPGTVLELDYVKIHMQGKFGYTQLIEKQATTATVLDEMERHDWVHIACHAHQNISDAKKSGFFLHDGVLDLDAINRRSFKGKGLAFLSACQTAMGDDTLPDEAVHLASGMLMAGYSSVIATMWSVGDDDAPYVADKVYGRLMAEGGLIGNGEAGKALHHAVAGLRERVGEKEFGRWVPFIHIGS
ncbi:unnamed protein product [Rhizoctonia solani]|uniref:CHAT domain-containing protein n=1 Tax=Rhizoctonia solani TaxID=456999 RepID=A0A8H3HX44_9AGAM|nr:unnamed protein product [Rhizoctonia solani]